MVADLNIIVEMIVYHLHHLHLLIGMIQCHRRRHHIGMTLYHLHHHHHIGMTQCLLRIGMTLCLLHRHHPEAIQHIASVIVFLITAILLISEDGMILCHHRPHFGVIACLLVIVIAIALQWLR
jgi:hypothetical protein